MRKQCGSVAPPPHPPEQAFPSCWQRCSPPVADSSTTDLERQYLQEIGRVKLLSAEEEFTLARLVQRRERRLEEQGEGDPLA